ncbi:dipeptidase PepV [Paenibacillus larvae]
MTQSWKELAESKRDSYIEDAKKLLSIPSTPDPATAGPGKPFGKGIADALEHMLQQARGDGFKAYNVEGYAGCIEYGEGEESIGVLVHMDVVPPGEGWTTPPFAPDIRGGRLYARGAIDDKGPAMAAYYGLKLVKESGLPLSKKIRFIIGTDEENKSLCMKRFKELDTMPEIGFSPDADFPIVHAEKGQLNVDLVFNKKMAGQEQEEDQSFTLRSFGSGHARNIVPDLAEAVLLIRDEKQASRVDRQFKQFLKEKEAEGSFASSGTNEWTLSVKGRAAHGSEPYKGRNAATLLASFLSRFSFAGTAKAFLCFLAERFEEDYYGSALGLASKDEISGKLTVNLGMAYYNSEADVPGRGDIRITVRYPVTGVGQELQKRLADAAASYGFDLQEVEIDPPHHVPVDHPMIQTLQRVYQEQTGHTPRLLAIGGGTYAREMKSGIAFGPLFPGAKDTAHQVDESVGIDEMILSMAIYAQAMYELAK